MRDVAAIHCHSGRLDQPERGGGPGLQEGGGQEQEWKETFGCHLIGVLHILHLTGTEQQPCLSSHGEGGVNFVCACPCVSSHPD